MSKHALASVAHGFNYAKLDKRVADKARIFAERIRQKVKKSLEDLIEVGNHLLAVKESLPHGQFRAWLQAEFGWAERTARNFMSVASQFGSKSAIFADLTIHPTAAYLLASPSVPEEAREAAIGRAEAGEQITPRLAKEIVVKARKSASKTLAAVMPSKQLSQRLEKVLERYRGQWNPKDFTIFAKQLRNFANSLVTEKGKPMRNGG